ncbi:CAP domain-containing protein [Alteromonas portus]|uniref:CAP domain-containing protein n=1 Tax=Alteromonas portus TaxID=2565549 RepID=A0A4U0ZKP5_9ALTE|nr:CAP domain-containing protein [Alteromonas portus]TKB03680.1 CAP domain-containing protein [Alteromonas portus]
MVKLLNLSSRKKGRSRGLFYRKLIISSLIICAGHTHCVADTVTCGNSKQAQALSLLIAYDKGQQRKLLKCNPILVELAEVKAKDMAERGLVSHFLGGSPNTRIRDAGLTLPEYYGNAMSNQVEALAGGYATAEDVWYALKRSTSHRQHLLGELPFYEEQDQVGIAFHKDYSTPHVEYWAVYLTKLADTATSLKDDTSSTMLLLKRQKKFDHVPDKGLDIVTKSGNITLKTKKPDE